jgi:hypothetical protein
MQQQHSGSPDLSLPVRMVLRHDGPDPQDSAPGFVVVSPNGEPLIMMPLSEPLPRVWQPPPASPPEAALSGRLVAAGAVCTGAPPFANIAQLAGCTYVSAQQYAGNIPHGSSALEPALVRGVQAPGGDHALMALLGESSASAPATWPASATASHSARITLPVHVPPAVCSGGGAPVVAVLPCSGPLTTPALLPGHSHAAPPLKTPHGLQGAPVGGAADNGPSPMFFFASLPEGATLALPEPAPLMPLQASPAPMVVMSTRTAVPGPCAQGWDFGPPLL